MYALVDRRESGDMFESIFKDLEVALKKSEEDWSHLTNSEKKKVAEFYLCECEVDEDGCIDFETVEVIKDWLE